MARKHADTKGTPSDATRDRQRGEREEKYIFMSTLFGIQTGLTQEN